MSLSTYEGQHNVNTNYALKIVNNRDNKMPYVEVQRRVHCSMFMNMCCLCEYMDVSTTVQCIMYIELPYLVEYPVQYSNDHDFRVHTTYK